MRSNDDNMGAGGGPKAAAKAERFRIAWCNATGGSRDVKFLPPGPSSGDSFYITNDRPFLQGLLSGTSLGRARVVPVAELRRIIFPEKPVEGEGDAGSGGAAELEGLWTECIPRLDAIPAWAHGFLSTIALNLDDADLADFFSAWAESLDDGLGERRWQSSFTADTRRPVLRPLPSLEDCSPLDPDDVASRLGPTGALARAIPGYEPRPGQIKMLKAVVSAFNEGRHLVVEAGTGIGKSLAYLLPCAMWARLNDIPVVVSTNTKNLQAQLVEKDLPAVVKVLAGEDRAGEAPLRAAVVKGRSNYLCLRRFGQMVEGGAFELSRPELRMLASAICWAVTTRDGDFDAITGSGAADPQFLQSLASGSEECIGRSCRHYSHCFVQKARDLALGANLVIANHSLVFTELGAETPISLPPHSQIVFDEAHNLEDAATNHFTLELSPSTIHAVTRRLHQVRGKQRRGILHSVLKRIEGGAIAVQDRDAALALAGDAIEKTRDFSAKGETVLKAMAQMPVQSESTLRYGFQLDEKGLRAASDNPLWRSLDSLAASFFSAGAALKEALTALAESLDASGGAGELNLALGDSNDLKAAAARLEKFLEDSRFVLDGTDPEFVFWIERPRRQQDSASAFAAPINVGSFLASNLYERRSSVVICSATLSVSGSFRFSSSRLGLDRIPQERIATCMAPSPFDYSAQCSLLIPEFLPSPVAQDKSYEAELSILVLRMASRYCGRTMVLFTSYEMMRRCADLLRDDFEKCGLTLLVQGESGSRNRMTCVFRQDGGSVLFGTQSFWEGVDVMGEALSCVIVAKLPFASPGDPIVSARCEQIEAAGGHSFVEYSVPLAVLKLRQGFGRLIRHRNDRGTVIVADNRIITKPYGRSFLSSLPAQARRCRTMAELEASLTI